MLLFCSIISFASDDEARVYYKGATIRLKQNTQPYEYDTATTIGNVPEIFHNVLISSRDEWLDGYHEPLEFKVKRGGVVFIIADGGDTLDILIEDEWIKVSGGIYGWGDTFNRKYIILKKTLDIGEYEVDGGKGFGTRVIDN